MDFSEALKKIKEGTYMQRKGWNGKGLYIAAQFPDEKSKMTLPYLYIAYPDNAENTPGAKCPWLASQTDIMTDDWQVANLDNE